VKFIECSVNVNAVCNFGQGWEEGYLTGVHTQYKALLRTEIKATVGVHIGLRAVNITLLGNARTNQLNTHNNCTRICNTVLFELSTINVKTLVVSWSHEMIL